MGRAPETPTQALHRLTSYAPGRHWTQPTADPRVRQDLRVNDMARFPWPCKRYADGLPRVPLPRSLPATSAPARGGSLRAELFGVCLDQALARDAAFVAIAATNVRELDDRQYREAQFAAGWRKAGCTWPPTRSAPRLRG